MAAKRVTRKQLLKEPDEFLTLSSRLILWIRNHPREVAYGVGIFFTVIALIAGVRFYRETRMRNASQLLSEGLMQFQVETAASKDAGKALAAVMPDFQRLVDDYESQPAGRLGKIYFGHIALNAGKADEAVDSYSKALEDYAGDPSVANIVLNGLAEAQARKGDTAAAIAAYEKIRSGNSLVYKDAALFNLGILYGKTDQKEKSKEVFEQLAEQFPTSMYAQIAKEKISG